MSLFESALQADAAFAFAGDGPTETIQIKDAGSSTWRDVQAYVKRMPPERVMADGTIITVLIEITVANDATLGISTAAMDASGKTRAKLARRYGAAVEEFGVYLPPPGSERAHHAGWVGLDLR